MGPTIRTLYTTLTRPLQYLNKTTKNYEALILGALANPLFTTDKPENWRLAAATFSSGNFKPTRFPEQAQTDQMPSAEPDTDTSAPRKESVTSYPGILKPRATTILAVPVTHDISFLASAPGTAQPEPAPTAGPSSRSTEQ